MDLRLKRIKALAVLVHAIEAGALLLGRLKHLLELGGVVGQEDAISQTGRYL